MIDRDLLKAIILYAASGLAAASALWPEGRAVCAMLAVLICAMFGSGHLGEWLYRQMPEQEEDEPPG